MLQGMIDRLTIARALARCQARCADEQTVTERSLPVFTPAGSRVGDPWLLRFDWSRFPNAYLSAPGALEVLRRALDALPPRHRAAGLIDIENIAAVDVAEGLGESLATVRHRLRQVRMAVRERLTEYFAAAITHH